MSSPVPQSQPLNRLSASLGAAFNGNKSRKSSLTLSNSNGSRAESYNGIDEALGDFSGRTSDDIGINDARAFDLIANSPSNISNNSTTSNSSQSIPTRQAKGLSGFLRRSRNSSTSTSDVPPHSLVGDVNITSTPTEPIGQIESNSRDSYDNRLMTADQVFPDVFPGNGPGAFSFPTKRLGSVSGPNGGVVNSNGTYSANRLSPDLPLVPAPTQNSLESRRSTVPSSLQGQSSSTPLSTPPPASPSSSQPLPTRPSFNASGLYISMDRRSTYPTSTTPPVPATSTSPDATPSTPARLRALPRLLSNAGYSLHASRLATSTPVTEGETEPDSDLDSDEDAATDGSLSDPARDDSHNTSPTTTPLEVTEISVETASTSNPTALSILTSVASAGSIHSASPLRSPNNIRQRRPVTAPSSSRIISPPTTTIISPTPSTTLNNFSRPLPARIDPVSTSSTPWATFGAQTRDRTPRSNQPMNFGNSYFDLPPRGYRSGSATPKTPGHVPMMSPLIPMTIRDEARGLRPIRTEDLPSVEESQDVQEDAELGSSESNKTVRRSRSAVNLLSPNMLDEDDVSGESEETRQRRLEREAEARMDEFHSIWSAPGGPVTPAPAFISPTPTSATPAYFSPRAGHTPTTSPITRPSAVMMRTNRPRSMYELHVAPPVYSIVYTKLGQKQIVVPREEEGIEGLPDYTCSVHIEGYYPRKLEFTAPSVVSKDRGWKRQYFVLHGTSIKIFKHDLRTHPMSGEDDWSLVSAEIAGTGLGAPAVHFHQGEYGSTNEEVSTVVSNSSSNGADPPSPPPIERTFIQEAKEKAKSHLLSNSNNHPTNVVVRNYTLQNAESGLAADYIKRQHVVRVRAGGEQFLLQAKDDRGVIDLIEALQAATNVALDLDDRPLPKFITLPRRRRRRVRVPGGGVTEPESVSAITDIENPTVAAAREENRLQAMLAEEQNNYARNGHSASVM